MIDIKEMILLIEKRPGICVGDKRVDYLSHYLTGRLEGTENKVDQVFRSTFSQYMHDWINKNVVKDNLEIEFNFNWYKMIYSVTNTEEEAWELFFNIAHEFFLQLDVEN